MLIEKFSDLLGLILEIFYLFSLKFRSNFLISFLILLLAETAIKTNPVPVAEASAPPIAPPYSETDDQLSMTTNGHLPHHAPFSYIARQNQFSNLYPDLYIPENEFDLPPSYEESVAPTTPAIPVN